MSPDQTTFRIEFDRETDGRWIAILDCAETPDLMVYGHTRAEALLRVLRLSYQVLSDRLGND